MSLSVLFVCIGHFTLLYYIIPSLPHPVFADYFWIRYRGKMVFLILVHVHDIYIYIFKGQLKNSLVDQDTFTERD